MHETLLLFIFLRNSRRTSTSPIVVVDQNPSRRSSGANVLDAAEKEREERKRKNTINDIDWVAAFAMKVGAFMLILARVVHVTDTHCTKR